MGRKNRSPKRKISNYEFSQFDFDEEMPFQKTQHLNLINRLEYKTEAQKKAHKEIKDHVLSFIGGAVGTGKTFIAVAEAVELLKQNKIKKIVVSRPTVTAGKEQGHLPGDLNEKNKPFLIPIYDNLEFFIGKEKLKTLLEEGVIEVVPIQYMRGRTLHDAFIIIDEAQNATKSQLRLALTRIGENAKCAVCFDEEQIDLNPRDKENSCVYDIAQFQGREEFGFFQFSDADIIRSEVVKQVLKVYREIENA